MTENFLRLLEAKNKENALWAKVMLGHEGPGQSKAALHELLDQLKKAAEEFRAALAAYRPE